MCFLPFVPAIGPRLAAKEDGWFVVLIACGALHRVMVDRHHERCVGAPLIASIPWQCSQISITKKLIIYKIRLGNAFILLIVSSALNLQRTYLCSSFGNLYSVLSSVIKHPFSWEKYISFSWWILSPMSVSSYRFEEMSEHSRWQAFHNHNS